MTYKADPRRTRLAIVLASTAAAFAFTAPAYAAGTVAGTKIDNVASATYASPGGGPDTTTQSNTVSLTVDEVLDVTLVSSDPGQIPSTPSSTGNVTKFTLTNTGNGSEAFTLTATPTVGGDNFDPSAVQIALDTNGNGTYDPGVDTIYTAGVNDPVLVPDASTTVFVISTMPAGVTDGQTGIVRLTAEANTALAGANTPGTVYPGQGQGGGDAVVGSTGADDTATATYIIQAATVALQKSATVLNSFGGTDAIPGAIITYTLVANISGTGAVANLRIGDVIPAGTTYVPGSLTLEGAALSDATDGDAGEFTGTAIATRAGTVAGGQTRTVTFKVKIN